MFEIIGQILIGWLLADLLTGTFHWWEDRIASEQTLFFGPRVVIYNRIHHRNPSASLLGSFWFRNRESMITAAVVSILWLLIAGPSFVWASATLGGMFVTEVHYLAHHPSRFKVLQDIGIFQSPKHHSIHHSGKQDIRYCVLTNFLNPVLDRIGLWPALERMLVRVGVRPSYGES